MGKESSMKKKEIEAGAKEINRPYFQGMVIFMASLGGFSSGQAPAMAGYIIPQITKKEDMGVDVKTASWFASVLCLGMVVGSLNTGYLSGSFGRKKAILINLSMMLLGNLVVGWAQSFPILLVGRVFNGMAMGGLMAEVPNYCAEISQPQMRARASALQMLQNTTGISLAYVVGAVLPWRWAVFVFASVTAVNIVGLWFLCPESHVWMLLKKRDEEALVSLTHLRGCPKVAASEMEKIKASQKANSNPSSVEKTFAYKCRSIANDRMFRRPFLSCLMLRVLGLDWSGFFILGSYLVTFAAESEVPLSSFTVAAALSSWRIILAFLTLLYISTVKMKMLYIGTSGILSVGAWLTVLRLGLGQERASSMFGETIASYMTLVGMGLLYTGYGLGMAQVCFIMPSELLPSKRRSIGIGLLNFINGLSTFAALQAVPFIIEAAGVIAVFAIFGTVSVVSALLLWIFVPETKGKTLQDIEREYRIMAGLEKLNFFADMITQMTVIKSQPPVDGAINGAFQSDSVEKGQNFQVTEMPAQDINTITGNPTFRTTESQTSFEESLPEDDRSFPKTRL